MGRGRRVVFSIYGTMVLISILFISIPEASAASLSIPFTLEDENAEVTIDVGPISFLDEGAGFPERGVNTWVVDDVENMFQQWFWFRSGSSGAEFSIDTLTLATSVTTDADGDGDKDTLNVVYTDGQLKIDITWRLKGGPAGSGASTIEETIVITCGASVCNKMHFFQYSDFDLDITTPIPLPGEEIDDSLELINPSTFVQIDGLTTLSETVVTPTPDHFEVNEFPDIRTELDDDGPTTLADIAGPITDKDGEWAFQWDAFIGPFESDPLTIVKCKRIGTIAGGITGNPGCEPIVGGPPTPSGGHEPPTIGMNLGGNNQIVENGICIDAQCWTVTENFHVDFELVQMLSGDHTISNTVYCSRGVDTCNHITLSAGPYHENTRNFDEALWKVFVDKNLLGELTVTKDDPDGYLGVTTCTAQITLEERWFTSCTIDFKLPTPGGFMLGVQVQDNYKGVRNWFFNDGIEIIDTFGYPSVDTEFESSLDVPRLCLSDDPDKRTSCAFAKKVQLEIERAEKLLT